MSIQYSDTLQNEKCKVIHTFFKSPFMSNLESLVKLLIQLQSKMMDEEFLEIYLVRKFYGEKALIVLLKCVHAIFQKSTAQQLEILLLTYFFLVQSWK